MFGNSAIQDGVKIRGENRFTEEQIGYALSQQLSGTPLAELTRKLGISEQAFYRYKDMAQRGLPTVGVASCSNSS